MQGEELNIELDLLTLAIWLTETCIAPSQLHPSMRFDTIQA